MTSFTLAHDLFDSVAVLGACCSSSVPICAYMCQGFFFHTCYGSPQNIATLSPHLVSSFSEYLGSH